MKDASSEQIAGDGSLPRRAYADPVHELYPIHTKAATWVSAAYFYDDGVFDETVDVALTKAATFHGILTEIELLKKQAKETVAYLDMAVDPAQCAITWEDDNGKLQGVCPVRTPAEVKAAAEYLEENQRTMAYEDRQKLASAVLQAAQKHDVHFASVEQTLLEKIAGVGNCPAATVASFLRGRAALVKSRCQDGADEFNKIAALVESVPAYCHDSVRLVKLAAAVHDIDEQCGLRIEDGYTPPEDVFFSVTKKAAEDLLDGHCQTPTGNVYSVPDFAKVSLDDVRDSFGDDFAKSVSAGDLVVSPEKMAEVIPTLPRPDMELMETILDGAGIVPVMKEAASKDWIERDLLEAAAREYKPVR